MKKNKLISIIIMVIFFIQILSPIIYANLINAGRDEAGNAPSYTPPDTPTDVIQNNPPRSSDIETIPIKTAIKGQVLEDLGHIKVVKPDRNGIIKEDNTEKNPIKDVIVNLYNSRGKLVDTTRTNENGEYSFSPSPGNYYTEFWYGDIDGADINSDEEIKNILKYNGQDYMAVETPGQKEYIDYEKLEVINSGKGALQIYIAIDCSYSMRSQKINGVSKLELIVDAAEKLCDSLIDMNENIYIGLVFFSGTNYRAASLTKNKSVLKETLENIKTNDWCIENTDIHGALEKAYNSFYNNDKGSSNRYVILLSDGVPTAVKDYKTYRDDSNEEIMNKLNSIANQTKQKLAELKNNGVKTISLFTKAEDDDENELVEKIFKEDSNIFKNIENINDTVTYVRDKLKIVFSKEARKRSNFYQTSHEITKGYEDKARRNEINKLFNKNLNYRNTIIFDQIENYNHTNENSVEAAKKLSETTKMRVVGGKGYKIQKVPDVLYYEEKDDKGNIIRKVQYVIEAYEREDLVLAKRPNFLLSTNITATRLKINIGNGETLSEQRKNTGAGPEGFILQYLDTELVHGAEIEVDYTIDIKNDSSAQCDYLEILAQIPKGFTYKNNNGNYSVEKVSLKDLKDNNLITEDTFNSNDGREVIKITLNNDGKGAEGFYIPSGGNYELTITISRLASSYDEYIEKIDDISAEILQYRNNDSRRMSIVSTTKSSSKLTTKVMGVYPGDSKNVDFSNKLTNLLVSIIPPTGAKNNYIILGLSLSIIILLAIVNISHKYYILKKH